MTSVVEVMASSPATLFVYAYVAYPSLLWLGSRLRPFTARPPEPGTWPTVTVTITVYNEAANITAKLDDVLQLDYPADKLQLLVISDASTDDTDQIVREYA